jgi:hypothetical protein
MVRSVSGAVGSGAQESGTERRAEVDGHMVGGALGKRNVHAWAMKPLCVHTQRRIERSPRWSTRTARRCDCSSNTCTVGRGMQDASCQFFAAIAPTVVGATSRQLECSKPRELPVR